MQLYGAGQPRHPFTDVRLLEEAGSRVRAWTGIEESTRSSTFARVSRFRKYSFVNALHSSLEAFDLCAYLQRGC